MASWRCLGCRTVYAVGIPACPHCWSAEHEEDDVAKANPQTGATFYVAEGDPVPDDLPAGVRPVGPGAPAPEADVQDDPEPDVQAAPEPPPARASKAEWVGHAKAAGLPEDEAEGMTKAALIEAVQEKGLM